MYQSIELCQYLQCTCNVRFGFSVLIIMYQSMQHRTLFRFYAFLLRHDIRIVSIFFYYYLFSIVPSRIFIQYSSMMTDIQLACKYTQPFRRFLGKLYSSSDRIVSLHDTHHTSPVQCASDLCTTLFCNKIEDTSQHNLL